MTSTRPTEFEPSWRDSRGSSRTVCPRWLVASSSRFSSVCRPADQPGCASRPASRRSSSGSAAPAQVWTNLLREVARFVDEESLLVIDSTDLTKRYARQIVVPGPRSRWLDGVLELRLLVSPGGRFPPRHSPGRSSLPGAILPVSAGVRERKPRVTPGYRARCPSDARARFVGDRQRG